MSICVEIYRCNGLNPTSTIHCELNSDFYFTPIRGASLLLNRQFCTSNNVPERDPITTTVEDLPNTMHHHHHHLNHPFLDAAIVGAVALGAYELWHHHHYGNFGFGNPYHHGAYAGSYGTPYGY